jgi:hypothetical protein
VPTPGATGLILVVLGVITMFANDILLDRQPQSSITTLRMIHYIGTRVLSMAAIIGGVLLTDWRLPWQ